jgi:MFS family permease
MNGRSRPDTLAPWTVAALIAVMFVGTTLVTPLYELYRKAFGFSGITLTLIYAVYVVGNLVALMFFGRLSDQIGRRRVTFPVIGVGVLSALVFLFAQNVAWLFVARVLSGFAIGLSTGTGAAWLAELYTSRDKSRATLVAIVGNLVGLSVGALMAGLLVQYEPWPLRLVYAVYIVMLVGLALVMRTTPETVEHPVPSLRQASMTPRLGVPANIRSRFIAPAVAGFGGFALFGFYAALAPSVLQDMHQTNRALGGGVVFELCIVATAAVLVTRRMKSRTAMLAGLALLLPSLVLLVLAQAEASMTWLLIGTAVGGVATSLCYRGSLQVVNEIAPSDRRAEVISTYLICCYVGNSLPVMGVGVLSALSTPVVASSAFAVTIGLFAVAALFSGVGGSAPRHRPE